MSRRSFLTGAFYLGLIAASVVTWIVVIKFVMEWVN